MAKNNKTRFSYVLLQYIIWLRYFWGAKEGKKINVTFGEPLFSWGPLLSEFYDFETKKTLGLRLGIET